MFLFVACTVLFATILGSISGIGGGVLIKPVMDSVCDLSSSQISFMSGTTVLAMTISSLLKSRKNLKVEKRTFMLALGAATGGFVGKQLFSHTKEAAGNDAVVGLVQNIVMVIIVGIVFVYTVRKDNIKTKNITGYIASAIIGFIMGVLSSFLGIGGGPINIMILSYFFSMDTKTSALNSLFVIFFSQLFSFLTSCVTRTIPEINILMLAVMIVLAVAGSLIGRKLSGRMSCEKIDKLFMCFMTLIIILSAYNCFKFAVLL